MGNPNKNFNPITSRIGETVSSKNMEQIWKRMEKMYMQNHDNIIRFSNMKEKYPTYNVRAVMSLAE